MDHAVRMAKWIQDNPEIDLANVVKQLSQKSGITSEALLSPRRTNMVAHTRFVLFDYYHRKGFSYHEIAELTRRVSHATVMHGINELQTYASEYHSLIE